MRPISKLMIANALPLARALELIKLGLVQEAAFDPDVTDSHISLKTGVHRKDVKRLREIAIGNKSEKLSTPPLAAVLNGWSKTSKFCDAQGTPRALLRQSSDAEPGFDALVRSVRIDLPPATVLAELLAQDMVTVGADGRLELMSDTYLPKIGDAVLDAFDATVADHLKVATSNAIGDVSVQKEFDRVLRYSHLSKSSVERLEAASRAAALQYLDTLNTLAHELQTIDDTSDTNESGRFVTGVFIAPETGEPTPNKGKKET
ncbi:DUF6502 family protein [Litoreibacter sp.]|nr:DUF6502 family protein [Litoreibacter sp.]